MVALVDLDRRVLLKLVPLTCVVVMRYKEATVVFIFVKAPVDASWKGTGPHLEMCDMNTFVRITL